mmetsp:Transcript_49452/g.141760  ORF Transcript_49452/g.141760 Transcript_49452/m.141760 type:complete len:278 (-) Transcript_49452:780-1613(-)
MHWSTIFGPESSSSEATSSASSPPAVAAPSLPSPAEPTSAPPPEPSSGASVMSCLLTMPFFSFTGTSGPFFFFFFGLLVSWGLLLPPLPLAFPISSWGLAALLRSLTLFSKASVNFCASASFLLRLSISTSLEALSASTSLVFDSAFAVARSADFSFISRRSFSDWALLKSRCSAANFSRNSSASPSSTADPSASFGPLGFRAFLAETSPPSSRCPGPLLGESSSLLLLSSCGRFLATFLFASSFLDVPVFSLPSLPGEDSSLAGAAPPESNLTGLV